MVKRLKNSVFQLCELCYNKLERNVESGKYYLAYGSKLNREQMAYRCPNARPVGTSQLEGWRLLFRGSGSGNYLTIEPAPGCVVPVAVWAVTKADEAGLPTTRYMDTCEVGYRDFGFDPEALLEARAYTREVMALEKNER